MQQPVNVAEYHCNNPRCRQSLFSKQQCFVTPCFHLFCATCSKDFSSHCLSCGLECIKLKPISLNQTHGSGEAKLLGMGIEEILSAAYAAAKLQIVQKDIETRQILGKVEEYKGAISVARKELDSLKGETRKLKDMIFKLVEENKKLFIRIRSSSAKTANGRTPPGEFSHGIKPVQAKTVYSKRANKNGFFQGMGFVKVDASPRNGSFMIPRSNDIMVNRHIPNGSFVTPVTDNNKGTLYGRNVSGSSMQSEFINHSGRYQPSPYRQVDYAQSP
eukprot:TRINITY_DN64460_c1_g1_i1.p3 TRINITY_DN64460_c1_g1~~TRINITY_DN64460_c1_g1_i1.p3  ORF type:complete len:274 (+),score=20.40 TRINITY_DN64460_c1_g1_i1:2079-2900(+)